MLYDEHDRPRSQDAEILNITYNFYSKLYNKPSQPYSPEYNYFDRLNPHLLDDEDKQLLGEEVTLEELTNALKGMKTGKAPGMDGLTVSFYKQFWEELGPLVHASISHAEKRKMFSCSQKRGVIKLLPKRDKNPHFVKNLRPITLLQTDLKIFTRAMSIRLKTVMDRLIANDQHAFVKGRYLGNSVLDIYSVAAEAISSDDDFVLLNLDIEKAFDSVNWCFLYKVLEQIQIPPAFINWIKNSQYKKGPQSSQQRTCIKVYQAHKRPSTRGFAQPPAVYIMHRSTGC